MQSTIQHQIVLETTKLEKLEKQAHQWVNQALSNIDKLDTISPQIKLLMDTADEKSQFSGPDMNNIMELSIQEKMATLSSLTTLSIDIQRTLLNWVYFQHQLDILAEVIVEVCVQRKPSIRLHSPSRQNNAKEVI